ncbi:hypothetical protein D3C76_1399850 [compost metagenome]
MPAIVLEFVQHIPNVITIKLQFNNRFRIISWVLNTVWRYRNPAKHEPIIFPILNFAYIPAGNDIFP